MSFQYDTGCIQARSLYSLKDVRKPLKSQPLFKINLEDGEPQVLCLKGYGETHPCTMLGVSNCSKMFYKNSLVQEEIIEITVLL